MKLNITRTIRKSTTVVLLSVVLTAASVYAHFHYEDTRDPQLCELPGYEGYCEPVVIYYYAENITGTWGCGECWFNIWGNWCGEAVSPGGVIDVSDVYQYWDQDVFVAGQYYCTHYYELEINYS